MEVINKVFSNIAKALFKMENDKLINFLGFNDETGLVENVICLFIFKFFNGQMELAMISVMYTTILAIVQNQCHGYRGKVALHIYLSFR